MKLKKALALILAMLMIFSFAACGSKPADNPASDEPMSKVEQIKAAGKLVVGTSADYPPYEFHTDVNGEDKIVGVDISIAQDIADELGVELELVDMAFDGLLISLQKGDFDMVLAALSPTEERKKSVDFSDVFFINKQIVVIKKADADKIKTTADVAELKGGCQSGTIQFDISSMYHKPENIIQLVKFNELLMELKTGKIDCLYTNFLTGTAYVSGNDDLMVQDIGIEWADLGFAAAIEKGNEDLVEVVNKVAAKYQTEGTIEKYIEDAVALSGGADAL